MATPRVSVRSDQVCECGCGEFTFLSPSANAAKGWVRGRARRFLAGHNAGGPPAPVEFVVNALTGCWIWQRGVNEKGYGVLKAGGRARVKAHRLYYERHVGAIPEGLDVHHLCQNRRCVNPAHLEAVDRSTHMSEHAKERYAAC